MLPSAASIFLKISSEKNSRGISIQKVKNISNFLHTLIASYRNGRA